MDRLLDQLLEPPAEFLRLLVVAMVSILDSVNIMGYIFHSERAGCQSRVKLTFLRGINSG